MSGCHDPNDWLDFITPATISVADWEHMQRKFTDLLNIVGDLSFRLNKEISKRSEIIGDIMTLHNRIVALEKSNATADDGLAENAQAIKTLEKILEHQAQRLEDFEARLDEMEDGDY